MIRRIALGFFAACIIGSAAAAQDAENTLVIEVTGKANGAIEIELLPDVAPLHVERIKALARAGAYDGVAFHRVITGFMAQTGDVQHGQRESWGLGRAGTGGSDMADLPAEFSELPFDRGVLGMARSSAPNSANSQFFIMFAEGHFLNGQYTVFGRVLSGMEVVDQIQQGKGQSGSVAHPDFMDTVRVKSDL